MYTLEMTTVAVSDFTEEMFYKMQNVESEKFMEYCNTINESATESAKNMSNGVKTIFAKIMANVFEENLNGNNPLLIDLVVRSILKYLSMTDLASARLVCKLWNDEASTYFRQTQRIIFYPESISKMSTFTNFVSSSKKSFENRYSSSHLSYPGPPFSTYCFTAQYTTTHFPRSVMQHFVSNCGQYVRKLEIFYPDDAYLSPKDFTAFYLSGMPNLESIHIVNLPQNLTQSSFLQNHNHQDNPPSTVETTYNKDNCPPSKPSHEQPQLQLSAVTHLRIDRTWQMETVWGKDFLQDLLSLMPNLLDYELWTWNSTTEDEHSEPYLVSLSPTNVQKLRVLRPGSIGDKLGQTIASMALTLSKLYLPVLNRAVGAETIERLLYSQRETLQDFQLNCSTMQDSRLITFPRMEKLTSLHMMITHPWDNDYTTFTPVIDYNTQFPRLVVLRVELAIYNDSNFINYFFPGGKKGNNVSLYNVPCKTLQELDISFSGFRDEKFIGIVSGIFPFVKKLKLDGYGSKIFSCIFSHMQNLECLELYLIYGFNVDDQMTGLSKEVCARLRKKEKFMEEGMTLDEVEDVHVNASLCSLKNLRSLSIKQKDYQAKFWPHAQCITNITAYLALSKMKQLTYAHIESVKFTQECKKNLATELEDCWLDFT